MGAIAEAGLHVPEDISIVGYDDIQLSAFTQPPLTTVSLSRTEIANAAFQALLNARLSEEPQPVMGREYLVFPTFVPRKSTGPAPKQNQE